MNWQEISDAISAAEGEPFSLQSKSSVGGGCINEAWHIQGAGRDYFVKTNDASGLDMFEAETDGLREMYDTGTIRVPRPVTTGTVDRQAYVVMEFIPLGGRSDAGQMGEQLAAMHQHTTAAFGWHRDNTIGSTPQPNAWNDSWLDFWREQRLGHQIRLAAGNGIGHGAVRVLDRLLDRLDEALAGHDPQPSLLHGDLWGGNAAYDHDGRPVIFDPACYYGDREADLAMTELFGGFGADFRAAYHDAWPIDDGYALRKTLYNQYHILNHFNLFGGGYGGQAVRMTEQVLAELG